MAVGDFLAGAFFAVTFFAAAFFTIACFAVDFVATNFGATEDVGAFFAEAFVTPLAATFFAALAPARRLEGFVLIFFGLKELTQST